ncbi:MAG: hypothetical protein IPL23_13685 [Saprospiraceae bacterium]|nr:hypothetical protein [Saprospiraceae bacterium]
MTISKKSFNRNKQVGGYPLTRGAVILGVLGIALTVYLGYLVSKSTHTIFSLSVLAIFAGLLFESFRIYDNWKHVVYAFIGAFLLSILMFVPKNGHYHEDIMTMWPYIFIFCFSIITAIVNQEKVTAKLTEGITLVQSISMIYWILDYGLFRTDHWIFILILVFVIVFSAFSIFHAFTLFELSKTARLTLSIWSAIIMVVFAVDNILMVYQNGDIENSENFALGFLSGVEYFLLGVSSIYLTQDIILLMSFIPGKNGDYKKDLADIKKNHITRYSKYQFDIGQSLICLTYAIALYGLNYKFEFLPRYTMIWVVFLLFPLVLKMMQISSNEKKYNFSKPYVRKYDDP